MSLITIEQLLESVDSELEPRWVAKDNNGLVCAYTEKPLQGISSWYDGGKYVHIGHLKLSEFDGKDWTKCIYEVPRKTTGNIEHIKTRKSIDCSDTPEAYIEKHRTFVEIWDKINELVDAVNELKAKGE